MKILEQYHCVPAYDELSRLETIQKFPPEISEMEQKTVGGLRIKLKAILASDYLKQLPETAIIKSGANNAYVWGKAKFIESAESILSETEITP